MTDDGLQLTTPGDKQILIERTFDAPPALVYAAWSQREHVRRWWAGRRGEMTVCEMDFRVGGRWRYVLIAQGGFEVAFSGEYLEIVPDERIVWTETYEAMPEHPSVVTVTFTEDGGRTRMSMLSEFETGEARDGAAASGMEAGIREQFEIIDELVRS